jgi:hypothetical protein
MSLFRKLFDRRAPQPAPAQTHGPEHALLVYLKLSNDEFGAEEEREAIHNMSDQMQAAINSASVGEFDGDEFGNGECTLFMYGPDADALMRTVEPILRNNPFTRGGRVIKRFGEASDPSAREVRIDL